MVIVIIFIVLIMTGLWLLALCEALADPPDDDDPDDSSSFHDHDSPWHS